MAGMSSNLQFETITEDTVNCLIFSSIDISDTSWVTLCDNINKSLRALSAEYLWHKDEFKIFLSLIDGKEDDLPFCLKSTTCFGDNIEDEWFIVYLVLEISKLYKDLIIQLSDSDGDFLLIEAADYLPSWANPDTTENRVFISNGHLHFIPAGIKDVDAKLTLKESISIIRNLPDQTRASPEIQQAIQMRINNYPEKINDNIHTAIVELPVDIATLLTIKPSLISPITSAYCNHDVIDAKSCKNVDYQNVVTIPIKFTKCLYAMLIHSKLIKNGRNHSSSMEKKKNLGLKLTYGYKMIMNRMSCDIFESKEFNIFKNSLIKNGFFKENLEGSKDYKELLEKAKYYFLHIDSPINTQICHEITEIMKQTDYVKLKESILKNPQDATEDSDDWLNINPDQLNDLLNSRYNVQNKFKSNDIITSQTVTTELAHFLHQSSDFAGIETNEDHDTDNNIEFDSEEFTNSVEKMLSMLSTGNRNLVDDEDDMDFHNSSDDDAEHEMDDELSRKCNIDKSFSSVLKNLAQSMKEEEGTTGPSSNLLRTVGFDKKDVLDSDDD